jgi:cytochrome bd-type quinol oxidase subunit 1
MYSGKMIDNRAAATFAIIIAVSCSVISFMSGNAYGRRVAQEQAVKAGVATWISDENGKPIFKWKDEDDGTK